ncbi:MAG: sulfatase-like hydrolase/transferase, partial [Planctomycetes bacterium]|nr:sulfatase-like hydrolase/transferase [Planctomycetota bacterium]
DAGLDIGRVTMQPIYDFVDRHEDQPFFIWYAPYLPHTPHDAPQVYSDRYDGRADVPEHLLGYYANITRLDDTVGELLDYLDRKSLAESTVFVLISDNGYLPAPTAARGTVNAPHDKRSKWSPYENGVRTPLLIRWDGHIRPATHPQLVQSVDIVPTLLAAAGLSGSIADLPGVDLLPSASGARPLADRAAFGEIYPNDASSLDNPAGDLIARWVRDGDWKLIVPQPAVANNSLELFNVVDDPEELHNMAKEPRHARVIRRLRQILDDWWMP